MLLKLTDIFYVYIKRIIPHPSSIVFLCYKVLFRRNSLIPLDKCLTNRNEEWMNLWVPINWHLVMG